MKLVLHDSKKDDVTNARRFTPSPTSLNVEVLRIVHIKVTEFFQFFVTYPVL